MMQERWTEVDRYFAERTGAEDGILAAAREAAAAAGLPAIEVTPLQGRLLHLLARVQGARTILEIGTLGGYSTIWLARALPPDGRLVSLEVDPGFAAVARANLERAGLGERTEIRVGRALDLLPALAGEGRPPFDLVFVDADKAATADYVAWALELTRPGSLIVADNVVRGGAVADPGSEDPGARGMRRFFDLVAAEPRLEATAIQTVGAKGHDGFALALVTAG